MGSRREFLALSAGAATWLASAQAVAQSQDLAGLTLKRASDLIHTKAVSPVELTQAALPELRSTIRN